MFKVCWIANLAGIAVATVFATGCGTPDPASIRASTGASPATTSWNESAGSSQCGSVFILDYGRIAGFEALVWGTQQIVVGTVIQNLGSSWSEPLAENDPYESAPIRDIYTDYLIRVDSRVRGQPFETLQVRFLGGTIDDCTIIDAEIGRLAVGDQFLFFLATTGSVHDPEATYDVALGPSGLWPLAHDGTVKPLAGGGVAASMVIGTPDADTSRDTELSGIPYAVIADRVVAILESEPPGDLGQGVELVPLVDAPISTEITIPTPVAPPASTVTPQITPAVPITEADAVAIAREIAQVKGDANATLVSVEMTTLKDALATLSPGMELIGYDPAEPVFVVRLRGGPFDHVRSIPLNRKADDFLTNGLFVVVSVDNGDVIGTGALRY